MVDEFLKRIFTVLHSNDPVARALTLRTLGAVSVIIPERKQGREVFMRFHYLFFRIRNWNCLVKELQFLENYHTSTQ